MPSLFHCSECDEWYEEDELADIDDEEMICITCATCDCGDAHCDECRDRAEYHADMLVDMHKEGLI